MITIPIGVTESGNGYVKFPDGTLIQWGSFHMQIKTNGQTDGYAGITFKAQFINDDVIVMLTNTYINSTRVTWSVSGANKANFNAYFYAPQAGFTTAHKTGARWIAIGRWK